MVEINLYEQYRAIALERGWKVPAEPVRDPTGWLRYWRALEYDDAHPFEDRGRPVLPHRSGGRQ